MKRLFCAVDSYKKLESKGTLEERKLEKQFYYFLDLAKHKNYKDRIEKFIYLLEKGVDTEFAWEICRDKKYNKIIEVAEELFKAGVLKDFNLALWFVYRKRKKL